MCCCQLCAACIRCVRKACDIADRVRKACGTLCYYLKCLCWCLPRSFWKCGRLCLTAVGLKCCCWFCEPVEWCWDTMFDQSLGVTEAHQAAEKRSMVKYVLKSVWNFVEFWIPLSVVFMFLWLLYRPDRFHPRVDNAVLAVLDLTHGGNASTDMLHYSLKVSLSFRNSHRGLRIRYPYVGATAFYGSTRLGASDSSLPSFVQGPKNTTVLHPEFHGLVTVDSGTAAQLEKEKAAGVVHMKVVVELTLVYKLWFLDQVVFYKYNCWLWLPPPTKSGPSVFHGDGKDKCWRF